MDMKNRNLNNDRNKMMRTDGRDNKGALASKSSLTSQNITKHKKEKAI